MNEELLKNKEGLTEAEFLQSYDPNTFDRPSVTVDMLIFTVINQEIENYRKLPEKKLKLLLIKRGEHPYIGQWALPGGFVSVNESLEEAMARELQTETNIENIYMEQLYTWGDIGRDPRTRVISCSYMALVDSSNLNINAGDDAADAQWFNIEYEPYHEKKTIIEEGYIFERLIEIRLWNGNYTLSAKIKIIETVKGTIKKINREIIENNGLAFDHAKIIEYAVERLRNKIEYTDIAFNLMPEFFTLTELQQVYEVILGKELLTPAFRRKVKNMVIETNKYTKDGGHRPSKLYKYNPKWEETN